MSTDKPKPILFDWKVDELEPAQEVSDGSDGGRLEICFDRGNKDTVGISVNGELMFWLPKRSCIHVRNNGRIEVSLSGNAEPGDIAVGRRGLVDLD